MSPWGEGSYWGLFGLAGAMSLCCIGIAALAGGAAVAGGGAAGVTAASGPAAGGVGGLVVTGLATALPLFVIGLILRRRSRP